MLWQLLTVMTFMSCVEFCLGWDAFGQDLNWWKGSGKASQVVTTEIELLVRIKWGFQCTFNSTYNMDLLMTVLKKFFVS
jgi:hypothetical protein